MNKTTVSEYIKKGPPAQFFTWHEVRCRHCFKLPPIKVLQSNAFKVMSSLADGIRVAINRPLVVSSWWRCAKHPIEAAKAEPGVHYYGLAMDVIISGKDVAKAIRFIMAQDNPYVIGRFGLGLRQFGPHDTRFLHFDIAGNRHRWSDMRPWIWTYRG